MSKRPRKVLRISVRCPITYTSGLTTHGGPGGLANDLSMYGCQVESGTLPATGAPISYRLQLTDQDEPVEVRRAFVQRVHGREVGNQSVRNA